MKTNKEKLGYLGEKLVANILNLTLSENKYDPEKDGIVNGTSILVEIKTQNRHPLGFFTVDTAYQNQLPKCLKVDRLIFVEYDESSKIKIWECHDRTYKIITTRAGKRMAGWKISDMKLIHTENNSYLAEKMRKLSGAKQFTNN